MKLVTSISNDAHQQTTVVLADNTSVVVSLDFLPSTQRWVMGVTWGTFSAKSIPICESSNLLRSYRNVIPFGFSCMTGGSVDPFDIEDFVNGRSQLYLLDSTNGNNDVKAVEYYVNEFGL